MRQYANPTYHRRREAGLCPRCGLLAPVAGRAYCQPCLLANAQRSKQVSMPASMPASQGDTAMTRFPCTCSRTMFPCPGCRLWHRTYARDGRPRAEAVTLGHELADPETRLAEYEAALVVARAQHDSKRARQLRQNCNRIKRKLAQAKEGFEVCIAYRERA